MDKEKPTFGLVVLCPAAVFGPMRHVVGSVTDLNPSNGMFWKVFCNAGRDIKLPKQTVYSYVDVRVRTCLLSYGISLKLGKSCTATLPRLCTGARTLADKHFYR
jgi:hypothetical protein